MTNFKSVEHKTQMFQEELKELLARYNANMVVETVYYGRSFEDELMVYFEYDNQLFETTDNGVVPELNLGRYVNGE